MDDLESTSSTYLNQTLEKLAFLEVPSRSAQLRDERMTLENATKISLTSAYLAVGLLAVLGFSKFTREY